jgi:hypothetical protein
MERKDLFLRVQAREALHYGDDVGAGRVQVRHLFANRI